MLTLLLTLLAELAISRTLLLALLIILSSILLQQIRECVYYCRSVISTNLDKSTADSESSANSFNETLSALLQLSIIQASKVSFRFADLWTGPCYLPRIDNSRNPASFNLRVCEQAAAPICPQPYVLRRQRFPTSSRSRAATTDTIFI